MNLDRVTITGADDSVNPLDLIRLSEEFPFVEWGILASASNSIGMSRYPTLAWIDVFREAAIANGVRPSMHLCGRWVRLILMGDIDPIVFQLTNGFARVQLNFKPEKAQCDPDAALAALLRIRDASFFQSGLQFIFQMDEYGNDHLNDICLEYVNVYGEPSNMFGLFDMSGGKGIMPAEWPQPIYKADEVYDYHGYAGGLGPDNLAEQIPLIGKAAGDCRIWIDMETKVRSGNDLRFDLAKVRRCLEIAAPFVN